MRALLTFIGIVMTTLTFSQKLDVAGDTKIQPNNDNTKDSVLVTDGNGVIYYRDISTMGDADSDPTNELQNWFNLPDIPAGFADDVDDVDDADADPTNEIETWSTLIGIPAGFADDVDDVGPPGTIPGEMQYWNGTVWVTVAPGSTGQVLTFVNGVPTWGGTPTAGPGEVRNPITGAIWMDRNLGATQVASSSTDFLAYGDLYQWGRGSDGHQTIVWTSSTTSNGAEQSNETNVLSNMDQPGHDDFITTNSTPFDWRSGQNANLWQGASGINNPCPTGYRLPTEAEWEAERLSWSSNNAAGAFASPLKLPLAGLRDGSDGSLDGVGTFGLYWSSTVSGTNARYLFFSSSNASMGINVRAFGYSVRCLKD